MTQDILPNVPRSTIVTIVAVAMLISGILSLCGGIAIFTVGSIASLVTTETALQGVTPETDAAARAAVAAVGAVSALATIASVLFVVSGIFSIVVAIGLFSRQPWARIGAIIAAAIGFVAALLGVLGAFDFSQIVLLILYGFVVYLFATDRGIREYFVRS